MSRGPGNLPPFTDTTVDTSTAVLLTSLNALALAMRPFTVVRTRGILGLLTDQVAATERQAMAYGQCVVSDQAIGIGVTAVPTPVSDSSSDLFFVFEELYSDFTAVATIDGFSRVGSYHRFDSKAMRKVEDGQDVISVVEVPAASSGTRVLTFFRTLIKLH